MDPLIIAEKIESLRRCVRRVEARRPATAAVGFRNIAVHNDAAVDWNIVFAIASVGLADFRDFARAISDWLSRPR